ncbi:mfs transporter protein [Diplodia corticola]|uniref:Mfs transporter protein n=1 Tax=Diplodia corticola TaxID=236234 RepID=A0A1J9QU89_9PEZI|nr:mfs transporter protein [Diplodia corticola]OJD32526.1 mfs transporter protein [Diplodia corticola]
MDGSKETPLSSHLVEEEDEEIRKLERRVRWKTDFAILPLLASVYFLAQMGRSDLANAKIAGMDGDLGLTAQMYSNVSSIFLVGYILFQLPGTLLLRKIGPPTQFAGAMMAWGVVTACTVAADGYPTLMVLRALVGAAEAFIQGAILYLSFWYRYSELATRGAILYSTVALAGSFNGLLAYAITRTLSNARGWTAWQWIFLIEGVVPIAWAFVVFALLPSTPERIRLGFSPAEKDLVIRRSRASHNSGDGTIRPRLILKLLADPKMWMVTAVDAGAHFCTSSLSNFIPAILQGLGYAGVDAQLMAVVVYAASFVGILTSCFISDALRKRGIVIVVDAAIAAVGYVLLLVLTDNTARLAATCVVAAAAYPLVVLSLAWTASNNVGYTFRASAAAIINISAQLVAIGGNQAFNDPPYYRQGLGASLGMICMSGTVAGLLMVYLRVLNKRKVEEREGEKAARLRECGVDEVGNEHPDFFFSF